MKKAKLFVLATALLCSVAVFSSFKMSEPPVGSSKCPVYCNENAQWYCTLTITSGEFEGFSYTCNGWKPKNYD